MKFTIPATFANSYGLNKLGQFEGTTKGKKAQVEVSLDDFKQLMLQVIKKVDQLEDNDILLSNRSYLFDVFSGLNFLDCHIKDIEKEDETASLLAKEVKEKLTTRFSSVLASDKKSIPDYVHSITTRHFKILYIPDNLFHDNVHAIDEEQVLQATSFLVKAYQKFTDELDIEPLKTEIDGDNRIHVIFLSLNNPGFNFSEGPIGLDSTVYGSNVGPTSRKYIERQTIATHELFHRVQNSYNMFDREEERVVISKEIHEEEHEHAHNEGHSHSHGHVHDNDWLLENMAVCSEIIVNENTSTRAKLLSLFEYNKHGTFNFFLAAYEYKASAFVYYLYKRLEPKLKNGSAFKYILEQFDTSSSYNQYEAIEQIANTHFGNLNQLIFDFNVCRYAFLKGKKCCFTTYTDFKYNSNSNMVRMERLSYHNKKIDFSNGAKLNEVQLCFSDYLVLDTKNDTISSKTLVLNVETISTAEHHDGTKIMLKNLNDESNEVVPDGINSFNENSLEITLAAGATTQIIMVAGFTNFLHDNQYKKPLKINISFNNSIN